MGRVKKLSSAVIIAALAFTTLTLTAGVAHASTATQESEFVSKINHERTSRGLRALTVKSDLVSVARWHSGRMASKGTIWHGDDTPYKITGWTIYGENVGMGPTVSDLHTAFMNSVHHRENILESAFNQIGVGIVVKDGTIYVTEIFVKRASTTTTTVRKTSTTTTYRSKPAVSRPTTTAARPVAKPAAPKPKPVPVAAPLNVSLLVELVGLDAHSVDPATGQALGV